jgi:hypothetical protein
MRIEDNRNTEDSDQRIKARRPLEVLLSAAGFYIGTADAEGPISRESLEYWKSQDEALTALKTGGWTQRDMA